MVNNEEGHDGKVGSTCIGKGMGGKSKASNMRKGMIIKPTRGSGKMVRAILDSHKAPMMWSTATKAVIYFYLFLFISKKKKKKKKKKRILTCNTFQHLQLPPPPTSSPRVPRWVPPYFIPIPTTLTCLSLSFKLYPKPHALFPCPITYLFYSTNPNI